MSQENNMTGAYHVDPVVGKLPQKVATGFSSAMSQIVGAQYEPLVYCGSQVVNGTNHMIICKQTIVTRNRDVHVVTVVLHETLDGEFSILSIERIV